LRIAYCLDNLSLALLRQTGERLGGGQ